MTVSSRPQLQLAADVVHFGDLRLLQCQPAIGVVGARIEQILIEPQFVEFVPDIVVIVNAFTRGGQRVRPPIVRAAIHHPADEAIGTGAVHRAGHHAENLDEVSFNVDSAGAVAISEADNRLQRHPAQCPAIANDQ
jgi:hypothetical protein